MNKQVLNLTSADATGFLKTRDTFPAGVALESFAEGDAISVSGVTMSDMIKGVDGATGYWYIPNVKEMSMHFLPGSRTAWVLNTLAQAIEQGQQPELVDIVITLPSQGIVVTFSEGVLVNYPPMPGVKTRVDNVTYGFKFSKCFAVQI